MKDIDLTEKVICEKAVKFQLYIRVQVYLETKQTFVFLYICRPPNCCAVEMGKQSHDREGNIAVTCLCHHLHHKHSSCRMVINCGRQEQADFNGETGPASSWIVLLSEAQVATLPQPERDLHLGRALKARSFHNIEI